MIKYLKKSFLFPLIYFYLFLFAFCLQASQMPMISEQEWQSMTPAQQQEYDRKFRDQFAKMSPTDQEAYMQQAVEALFESLPEEQQKEVLQEVDRIERMSEQEREQYFKQVEKDLEKVFGTPQQQHPQPKPAPKPVSKPTPEPAPKIEKPRKAPEKASKEELALKEAIELIDEVKNATVSLVTKIESMTPIINDKVTKWGKKKKIKSWDGGYLLQKWKEKVNIFLRQLEILKDRDPKTKKHKHLSNFIQDEDLYNKLYNLSVDLADYESSVRIEEKQPLSRKIRKKTNKALKKLLNAFTNLLFTEESSKTSADIITLFDNLFIKYEAEAEKIKSKEQERAEQALQESKRPLYSKPPVIAGSSGASAGYYGSSSSSSSRYGGGATGSSDYYTPNSAGYAQGGSRPSSGYSSSGRSTYGGTEKTTSTTKQEPSPETDKKSAPLKARSVENDEKLKTDYQANRLVRGLTSALETLEDIVDEYPKIKNLYNYTRENNFDLNLAKTQIKNLYVSLQKATSRMQGLQQRLKKLKEKPRGAYQRTVKAIVETQMKLLENLIKEIQKIMAEPNTIASLSPAMKWAHFRLPAEQTFNQLDETLREKVPGLQEPITFETLSQAAKKFLEETVKTLGKK